jgi:flagellar hook-associated protein 3 FlgL
MIGRVTNQMSSQMVLSGIESSLDRLDSTEEELSTGKQINQPSDNPYGTSVTLDMNQQLSNLTGYNDNVTDGTAWAQASTSALSDMTNAVQRVSELVQEAANGSNNQSDLSDMADEVNQLIDEVKQDANTQYNGQYIFSGSATSTQPYPASSGSGPTDPYAGDTSSVNREIGPNTSLSVNVQLSSVLGTGQTTAGSSAGDGGLLNTLRNIADDLQSGNTSALSGADQTDLSNSLNSLEGLSSTAGSITDRLQMASSRIASLQTSDTSVLSNTEDADMAATETQFSTEQAALQAALQGGASNVQQSLMNFLSTS